MLSLSQQLSSHRDVKHKTLKRFLSQYKLNLHWHNSNVSKSYNHIRSIDDDFERFEPLFLDSLLSLPELTLSSLDLNSKNTVDIFKESNEIEFMTSEELSELNELISSFILHCVPYFDDQSIQVLIDYLIFKYNISVSFSEQLIASFIIYHDSEHYCKLLSLISLEKESDFYKIHESFKNVSLNFTEPRFISRNAVLSEIIKSFTLFKQISSIYNSVSKSPKVKSNIVSFYNFINTYYVITKSTSIDDNELRYLINVVNDGLKNVDNSQYLSSQLCLLISIFSSVQLKVAVQKDLVKSCCKFLNNINEIDSLSNDSLLLFSYFIQALMLMTNNQSQSMDKLPEDVTTQLFKILSKHETAKSIFNNSSNYSLLINLLFNSLILLYKGNDTGSKTENEEFFSNLKMFIDFVNTLDKRCLEHLFYKMIDELIKINCQIKSHNDCMIIFDIDKLQVKLNPEIKYKSHLDLLSHSLKQVFYINPNIFQHSLTKYINSLDYDHLKQQIEVILYVYQSVYNKITLILLILYGKFSKNPILDTDGDQKLDKFDTNLSSNLYIDLVLSLFKEGNTTEISFYLSNFIDRLENVDLSLLYSSEHLLNSMPGCISIRHIIFQIQKSLEQLDSLFINEDDKILEDTFDIDFILSSFLNHLNRHIDLKDKLYKHLELFFKIYEKLDSYTKLDVKDNVESFIYFVNQALRHDKQFINLSKNHDFNLSSKSINLSRFNNHFIRSLSKYENNEYELNTDNDYECLFNTFSLLFYQFESMTFVVNEDSADLEYTQMVHIIDLLLRYLDDKKYNHSLTKFVHQFYKSLFNKYEPELKKLYKKLIPLITCKRIYIILSNNDLHKIFIDCVSNATDNVEEYLEYIFKLFNILKNFNYQNEYYFSYSTDLKDVETHVPINGKYGLFNFSSKNVVSDTSLKNLISNHSFDYKIVVSNKIVKYDLFSEINADVFNNGIDLLLEIFEKSKNKASLFVSMLSNCMAFLCDVNFDYRNSFSKLVYKLANCHFDAKLSFVELKKPNSIINNELLLTSIYFSNDILDFNEFLNELRNGYSTKKSHEHNILLVIENYIKRNDDFFKLFILFLFSNNLECLYNDEYIGRLIKIIDESSHSISFLLSMLKQMALSIYSKLGDILNDDVIKQLSMFWILITTISQSNKIKVDNELLEFASISRPMLNISCKVNDIVSKYKNDKVYEYLGNVADDMLLISLNTLKNGVFWKITETERRELYSSFYEYYDKNNVNKNKAIELLFAFTDNDDLLISFINHLLTDQFNEHVFAHLVKYIESLKTYELLIQMILKCKLNEIIKLNLLCKVITNFTLSTDLNNKKVQSFVFNNSTILLDSYCTLKLDGNNMNLMNGINGAITNNSKDPSNNYNNESVDVDFHDHDINLLFNTIVIFLNHFLDRIYKLNDTSKINEGRLYKKFYHSSCTFIKYSLQLLGLSSFNFLIKCLNYLFICDIKLSMDVSKKKSDEIMRNTVTSTINNVIDFKDKSLKLDFINLLLQNRLPFSDECLIITYKSYLLYLKFNINEKLDFDIDLSHNKYQVLSNLLWINFKKCTLENGLEFELNESTGYVVESVNWNIAENISSNIITFVSNYVFENIDLIDVDVDYLNNFKSDKFKLLLNINNLLYSLISSLVYFKHYYQILQTNKVTLNDVTDNKPLRFNTTEIMLTNAILHIFRNDKIGLYNIHVYHILNYMFNNMLDKINRGISLNDLFMKRYDSVSKFRWDMNIIMELLRLSNKLYDSEKLKMDKMGFKYEKELDKMNLKVSNVLFDFIKLTSNDEFKDELFDEITYFRNEAWIFFSNYPPSSIDFVLEMLDKSFDIFKSHYKYNKSLDWSVIDTIYSLKLIILSNTSVSNELKNHADPGNRQLNVESNKLNKSIVKYMNLMKNVEITNDLINSLMILTCLLFNKYYSFMLNKEFYQFCLNLLLNFNSKLSYSENYKASELDDIHEKEFLNTHIDDFVKGFDDFRHLNLRLFNTEFLMAHITYYTSMKVDISTLINAFSNISTSDTNHLFNYISKLLVLLSLNIKAVKVKNKYHEDLKNIYFICIKYYSNHCYELTFGEKYPSFLNCGYNNVEDFVKSSISINSSLFNNSSSISQHFDSSFISFCISYFSLISCNNLIQVFEKHCKLLNNDVRLEFDDLKSIVENDLSNRLCLITVLTALYEYGAVGATNFISVRLSQYIHDLSILSVKEGEHNKNCIDKEMTIENTWTWFNNCRLVLEYIQLSIKTWNIQRGSVPDVLINTWMNIINHFITLFNILPINGDVKVDNITTILTNSIEQTIYDLINGFITQDDKIIKIISRLSDDLTTKPLGIKIACLVIMDSIWEKLGVHLTPTVKNVMPILGELVDDENEVVRRIANSVDLKVKEILYQN